MPTNIERQEKLKTLPKPIIDLYESKLANALNSELATKYQLTEEQYPKFLIFTGDVILGFNKIVELPRLLQKEVGLDAENAQKLTADLIDAWGPIVEREAEEAQAKKAEVASLADKIAAIPAFQPTPQPAPQSVAAAPATGEATSATAPTETNASVAPVSEPVPEPAKPIRTMEADMNRAHGYGYNQTPTTPTADDEPIIKATSQDELRWKQE